MYRIYDFGRKDHHDPEAEEFYEAAEMARKSVEKMRSLAKEMEYRYGERYFGMREHDGYGMREHHDGWDDMYGERRRRDSMGRYM